MSQTDLAMLRDAVSRLDSMDKIDYISAHDNVAADIAHLEIGARILMKKLEVEKLCGMTHTDEINAWIASQRLKEPPT